MRQVHCCAELCEPHQQVFLPSPNSGIMKRVARSVRSRWRRAFGSKIPSAASDIENAIIGSDPERSSNTSHPQSDMERSKEIAQPTTRDTVEFTTQSQPVSPNDPVDLPTGSHARPTDTDSEAELQEPPAYAVSNLLERFKPPSVHEPHTQHQRSVVIEQQSRDEARRTARRNLFFARWSSL